MKKIFKKIPPILLTMIFLSFILLINYFTLNYVKLTFDRESLSMPNRYMYIGAFAMTFGNSEWDASYIRNIVSTLLFIFPILILSLAIFMKNKFKYIIIIVLSIASIIVIIYGYIHLYFIYKGETGYYGEDLVISMEITGYFYIFLFFLVGIVSLIGFNRYKEK